MRILGLSAHTDDIELSAGGKLVKHLMNNDEIKIFVFSFCQDSLPKDFEPEKLKQEFITSMEKIGIEDYEIFNFPVRQFSEFRQSILDELVTVKQEFNPELIITHSINDTHQDHQVVAMESIRAFKNSASILAMQMPHNNLQFQNQYYERLTEDHMGVKLLMLEQYESQRVLKRKIFDNELILSWARLNGFCCNAEFAEVFEVVRMIG
jgi:LmbE family N-acetylglucosaminyl deacetylase